jgi:hypothetical protein
MVREKRRQGHEGGGLDDAGQTQSIELPFGSLYFKNHLKNGVLKLA